MNPTPAEIPKLIPVKCSAIIPPINAKGTFKRTNPASFAFPNNMNRSMKIPNNEIGTTCDNVPVAQT